MFRQDKVPGDMGISDFTQLSDVTITIRQKPLSHRFYHYRLVYSGWSFVKVILGGESFTALSTGLQDAFWRCGGVPSQHRTDSLSAAFNNHHDKKQFTEHYNALCKHYRVKPTRNNPGLSHENGAIESPHGHFKKRVKQALLIRGSSDFDNLDAYQSFIDHIIARINRQHKTRFEEEFKSLNTLPKFRTHDYSEVNVSVTSSSTISVKRVTYTVPSRLIGSHLRVHLYDDKLALFAGHEQVLQLPRVYAQGTCRSRQVDYRHVIHSLSTKPQAFRYSALRDDLLPSADYHSIWQYVDHHLESKKACKYIVSLLHLAASENCEEALGRYVCLGIAKNALPSLDNCREHFAHTPEHYPVTLTRQHNLRDYDDCISCYSQEINHG